MKPSLFRGSSFFPGFWEDVAEMKLGERKKKNPIKIIAHFKN